MEAENTSRSSEELLLIIPEEAKPGVQSNLLLLQRHYEVVENALDQLADHE